MIKYGVLIIIDFQYRQLHRLQASFKAKELEFPLNTVTVATTSAKTFNLNIISRKSLNSKHKLEPVLLNDLSYLIPHSFGVQTYTKDLFYKLDNIVVWQDKWEPRPRIICSNFFKEISRYFRNINEAVWLPEATSHKSVLGNKYRFLQKGKSKNYKGRLKTQLWAIAADNLT